MTEFQMFETDKSLRNLNFENSNLFRVGPRRTLRPDSNFGFDWVIEMTFEPKILSFLCNWCAYAGADLAESSDSNIRPTPV